MRLATWSSIHVRRYSAAAIPTPPLTRPPSGRAGREGRLGRPVRVRTRRGQTWIRISFPITRLCGIFL
jgi:hypothetical protein